MAAKEAKNDPPAELKVSGRRLWASIAEDFELDVHEEFLLLQACRCADNLDRLAVEAAKSDVTVINTRGDQVAHPALVESRQQSRNLSQLIASLRLPSGEEASRPQRRGASRGSYGLGLRVAR